MESVASIVVSTSCERPVIKNEDNGSKGDARLNLEDSSENAIVTKAPLITSLNFPKRGETS